MANQDGGKKKSTKKVSTKKETKTKTKRVTKKKGTKKLNPYMKFVVAVRTDVVKLMPTATVTEIAKRLGEMWRKLSDSEKKKYH